MVLSECLLVNHRHYVDRSACTINGNDNVTGGLYKVVEYFQNHIEDKNRMFSQLRTPNHDMQCIVI